MARRVRRFAGALVVSAVSTATLSTGRGIAEGRVRAALRGARDGRRQHRQHIRTARAWVTESLARSKGRGVLLTQ
jgi:hypothetical protein